PAGRDCRRAAPRRGRAPRQGVPHANHGQHPRRPLGENARQFGHRAGRARRSPLRRADRVESPRAGPGGRGGSRRRGGRAGRARARLRTRSRLPHRRTRGGVARDHDPRPDRGRATFRPHQVGHLAGLRAGESERDRRRHGRDRPSRPAPRSGHAAQRRGVRRAEGDRGEGPADCPEEPRHARRARRRRMIREATDADRPSLSALLAGSPQAGRMVLTQDRTPDVFARRRPYDARITLVHADAAGDIVATATCATKTVLVSRTSLTAGYRFHLAVVPHARRPGLAGKLLANLEDWARRQGAALLYAHIMDGNTPSLGTFRTAGYRPARTLVSRTYPVLRAVGPRARPLDDWDA